MIELTPKQKEAMQSSSASTLVIAGPGTGKTHILASRIQYLTQKRGIAPDNILALSFSESAAASLRKRVVEFLGTNGYDINIHTFHSFASQLINERPEIFGYKHNLKILTDIDRARLIQETIDELYNAGKLQLLSAPHNKYSHYKDIQKRLADIKKEGYTCADFQEAVEHAQQEFNAIEDEEKLSSRGARKGLMKREYEKVQERIYKNTELALIYKVYETKLAQDSLYDYEDMIVRAIAGIQHSSALREELHEQYRAILVDEYQDTNGAQNKFLFLIINKSAPNIFVVGDDDQAIYRFQGATIRNFTEFNEKFPQAKIVVLEDNFRSPQLILDAALALASRNNERITARLKMPAKKLVARGEHAQQKSFYVHIFDNDLQERTYIAQEIKKLHETKSSAWGNIAIITRTNSEQESIAEVLRAHGIPYSLSAEQNTLKEPCVASLFAIMRACINPNSDEDTLQFLLHPATPIATEDVWQILATRKTNESIYLSMWHYLKNKTAHAALSDFKAAQKTFFILNDLSSKQTVMSGAQWLQKVMEDTGYLNWITKQDDTPYLIANVRALTDEAKRVQAGNPDLNIQKLLTFFNSYKELAIALKPNLAQFTLNDTVKIMTAHNAKGQEFESVFVVNAVHGNWSGKKAYNKLPLPDTIYRQESSEEDERRLFYVALTRAKKNLYVTASNKYLRGLSGMEEKPREMLPTRFIYELPTNIKATKKEIAMDTAVIDSKITSGINFTLNINARQNEIIQNIVSDNSFALNATSFNAFLECPQKFLYEKVLRVPTIKTFSLTYGDAMHVALEQYYKIPAEKRSAQQLLQAVREYLARESTLTEAENKRIMERAQKTFAQYHKKLTQELEPVAVEYRFPRNKFKFGDARISGKIDKISPILGNPVFPRVAIKIQSDRMAVRVIDYKTSKKAKTLNAIKGGTQDKHAPDYLRQLLFYKLLLEQDKDFKYTPVEFALDFVEVPREIVVPITEEEYKNFQLQLKKVWEQIQTLEFLETRCEKCKYCML